MRWARAAFEALFPGEPGPPSMATLDVEGFLAGLFERAPLEPVLGLRIALWVITFAPLFALRRFTTLGGLVAADRERVLRVLASSPLYPVRQLLLLLKAMAALVYAADPQVRARLLAEPVHSASLRKRHVLPAPESGTRVTAQGGRTARVS
jgi:hypothetical protein